MTSLHPHWDHTHQWWLVYLGCATVMPGSGAVYGDALDRSLTAHELGKTTDRVGTKTFLVCAITPCATGLKTLGQFLRLFSLPLLNVKENAGDRKSLNRTLINCSPPFCPGMQTKWMARHDVAGGTCMKLLRKGSALNLARGCLAWIMDLPYWTVLAKTSQKTRHFFFCCPTWLVFFA